MIIFPFAPAPFAASPAWESDKYDPHTKSGISTFFLNLVRWVAFFGLLTIIYFNYMFFNVPVEAFFQEHYYINEVRYYLLDLLGLYHQNSQDELHVYTEIWKYTEEDFQRRQSTYMVDKWYDILRVELDENPYDVPWIHYWGVEKPPEQRIVRLHAQVELKFQEIEICDTDETNWWKDIAVDLTQPLPEISKPYVRKRKRSAEEAAAIAEKKAIKRQGELDAEKVIADLKKLIKNKKVIPEYEKEENMNFFDQIIWSRSYESLYATLRHYRVDKIRKVQKSEYFLRKKKRLEEERAQVLAERTNLLKEHYLKATTPKSEDDNIPNISIQEVLDLRANELAIVAKEIPIYRDGILLGKIDSVASPLPSKIKDSEIKDIKNKVETTTEMSDKEIKSIDVSKVVNDTKSTEPSISDNAGKEDSEVKIEVKIEVKSTSEKSEPSPVENSPIEKKEKN